MNLHRIATLESIEAEKAIPEEVALRLERAKAIMEVIGAADKVSSNVADLSTAALGAAQLVGDALKWHYSGPEYAR